MCDVGECGALRERNTSRWSVRIHFTPVMEEEEERHNVNLMIWQIRVQHSHMNTLTRSIQSVFKCLTSCLGTNLSKAQTASEPRYLIIVGSNGGLMRFTVSHLTWVFRSELNPLSVLLKIQLTLVVSQGLKHRSSYIFKSITVKYLWLWCVKMWRFSHIEHIFGFELSVRQRNYETGWLMNQNKKQ